MERVKGIGEVFLRAKDREKLIEWYRDHLGIDVADWGGSVFKWQHAEAPHAPDRLELWQPRNGR